MGLIFWCIRPGQIGELLLNWLKSLKKRDDDMEYHAGLSCSSFLVVLQWAGTGKYYS